MKRKILRDEECMSGTGWIPEDFEIECPGCSVEIISLYKKRQRIFKCEECGTRFKIKRGVQYLMRAEVIE